MNHTLSDIQVMTKRNLVKFVRIPQLIIFSTIQPVMMLLLFTYVFGGAIKTGTDEYINYLLPGILVQTVLFGAMMTGIGLVDDLSRGMIDRFRSLPMARSAVLAGRTITDLIRNLFTVGLMTVVGLLIGFRIDHGIFNFLSAVALITLFGFAFSWVSAAIGLAVKTPETAQVAGFIWVFPLAFGSSIFVPVEGMSSVIGTFAEYNPITYTVDTVRALTLGLPVGNNIWFSLAWIFGIMIIFVPLAINRYRAIS
ncbi:MAG: ABC transporter [Candidatus Yanofskybacteria bacterium RIFCSPHIGHO2_01_FULL_41_21]|uniref:Transport permease protein n=1 Tax=Candidatus Yanofskybacteria bacterium RIFCSPHIGHO2_01_FULL_41_21 TaxID=1802660 RepID=A0A1F8EAJ5_9BACT|nr:MAG: ABC transporter [Candidatus Yanofskybacteria bacterium RIFCSPHIGHO2_01_FULL_41_21]